MQGLMDPTTIVVISKIAKQAAQMSFVEHVQVVEACSALLRLLRAASLCRCYGAGGEGKAPLAL